MLRFQLTGKCFGLDSRGGHRFSLIGASHLDLEFYDAAVGPISIWGQGMRRLFLLYPNPENLRTYYCEHGVSIDKYSTLLGVRHLLQLMQQRENGVYMFDLGGFI